MASVRVDTYTHRQGDCDIVESRATWGSIACERADVKENWLIDYII